MTRRRRNAAVVGALSIDRLHQNRQPPHNCEFVRAGLHGLYRAAGSRVEPSTAAAELVRSCSVSLLRLGGDISVRPQRQAFWWSSNSDVFTETQEQSHTGRGMLTAMCGAVSHEDAENEDQNSTASSPRSIKGSLAFILDDKTSKRKRTTASTHSDDVEAPTATKRKRSSESAHTISSLLAPVAAEADENEARNATRTTAPLERKGSKYCIVEGCGSRAKHARRCWKHGGSVKCKVAGCRNRAKTKGVCWSHGGGTICSVDQCTTIAVSNGVCWAHGGGKRCVTPGCSRPAYERTKNMCSMHYNAESPPASKRKV